MKYLKSKLFKAEKGFVVFYGFAFEKEKYFPDTLKGNAALKAFRDAIEIDEPYLGYKSKDNYSEFREVLK